MNSESATEIPALLVTVNLWERSGPADKPLAYGFLTSTATVLVPEPPEELSSPWRRYLVRISRSPGPDGRTESILAGGISLAAVDGEGITTAAAVLTLVRPTAFTVPVVHSTPERVAELLIRHHGDQWAAHAELGFRVVRPEKDSAPPDRWWLGPAFAGDVVSSVKAFGWGTCCTSPLCGHHAVDPNDDPWRAATG
ncbi:hypothetical protein ABT093_33240 [Kitasatospora sp. NPDC002551]|uniref:hypothetical protein n=1 Tax=Kitasatospora sp. NPDC002551 TaxID=3154539 RepID=UPI003328511A